MNRLLKNSASRRDPALHGFCKCSHAIGWKLEAWLTAPVFLSFEHQASCLKLISALAGGLMPVFQQPVIPWTWKDSPHAQTHPVRAQRHP
jgi:hypothetical protein